MKNYYQILGIPENASEEDIRKAFRRLAFQYHPDKNPGHEKEAEQKFKDINEAYGVLSNPLKRREYDMALKGQFVGAGYRGTGTGFDYSQQEIFRNTFSDQATFDDLYRMFSQAGLRFDQEFLNRVFFNSGNVVFRVYYSGPGMGTYFYENGEARGARNESGAVETYKPNFIERGLMRFTSFILRKLLGITPTIPAENLDEGRDIEISPDEAISGGEKEIRIKRKNQVKKLLVKIPAGVESGTRIRLKGMGKQNGKLFGDLYLRVRVKA